MTTMTNQQSAGIRDPYRSLLILLGGILLALMVLAGQTGYRDDSPSPGQEVPSGQMAAGRQVAT